MLLMVVALLCATACGGSPDLPLAQWTLEVEGQPGEVPVELPAQLDEHLPRERTHYVLRTRVDPGALRGRELSLVIPHFEALVELYVEGERIPAAQYEPVEVYRHAGPHVWSLPKEVTDTDALALALRVDHRWTQSGWLGTVPQLRPSGRLGAHALAILLFNDEGTIATLYGLLLIGVMSLWVYLADRRRRSYRWFAVQLLSAAYYPLHVSGYSQAGVGTFDCVLMAVMLDVALFASVKFAHTEFGEDDPLPSRGWLWGLGVVVAAALVGFDPFWLTPIAGRATVLYLAAVVVYQIVHGVRLLRRPDRPRGATLNLMSWVILGATSIVDGAVWFGLGELAGGMRPAGVGLGAFALLSALRLALEHVHSMRVTEELNHQLERRVEAMETKQREVEQLNGRLRDQMSHRSRQLFAMLSQLPNSDRNSPQQHLPPGEVVNDRYRVMSELGAGGMGVVYAVIRLADEMRLALKVTMQADAWGLARLAREAEIAMLVDHANVVSVVDVDIDPRRGFLYMVMEHVDGPSLDEYKHLFGTDPDWSLDVLHQLACGLAALHVAGVVHRDLKPANVLLVTREDGGLLVKLTDFGISRTLDVEVGARTTHPEDSDVHMPVRSGTFDPATRRLLDAELRGHAAEASLAHNELMAPPLPSTGGPMDDSTRELRVDEVKELELWEPSSPLTQAGCIVGTPVFMAPELALDPPLISAAADMFSFGVLAHQVLTGRRPFAEPPVLMVAEGRRLPPEFDLQLKTIPAGMRATLRACLSLDPESRPSAARLVQVLADLIDYRRALQRSSPPSRPFTRVRVGDHEVVEHDPDAPLQREHETSPPEPHAA